MPKLYGKFSGSPTAADQQPSAPAPAMPMAPGAGSLPMYAAMLQNQQGEPPMAQMAGALTQGGIQLDPDGFPAGTPAGVRATMSPKEYMDRHPGGIRAVPSPSPVIPDRSPASMGGPSIDPETLNKFQQGMKNVR